MELKGQLHVPAASSLPLLASTEIRTKVPRLYNLYPRQYIGQAITARCYKNVWHKMSTTDTHRKKFNLHNRHLNKNVGCRLVIANVAAFSDTYIMENSREKMAPYLMIYKVQNIQLMWSKRQQTSKVRGERHWKETPTYQQQPTAPF